MKSAGKGMAVLLTGATLIVGWTIGTAASSEVDMRASYAQQPVFHATAKCEDGTWSWKQNASTACSGHGGVATIAQR